MLDVNLADLYGTSVEDLRETVGSNENLFPVEFAFRPSEEELHTAKALRTDSAAPMTFEQSSYVFTEYGVTMVAATLDDPGAIEACILVVRAFRRQRLLCHTCEELESKLVTLEQQLARHDRYLLLLNRVLQDLPGSDGTEAEH
jgi:hypothetical protein